MVRKKAGKRFTASTEEPKAQETETQISDLDAKLKQLQELTAKYDRLLKEKDVQIEQLQAAISDLEATNLISDILKMVSKLKTPSKSSLLQLGRPELEQIAASLKLLASIAAEKIETQASASPKPSDIHEEAGTQDANPKLQPSRKAMYI
ncbi:MAG: hypothetical protein ABI361_00400 [Nitrososphaera sp.]